MNNDQGTTIIDDDDSIDDDLNGQLAGDGLQADAPQVDAPADELDELESMSDEQVSSLTTVQKRARTKEINRLSKKRSDNGGGGHGRASAHASKDEARRPETEYGEFTPGSTLDTPPPRPGHVQRLIRVKIRNEHDDSNVISAKREGYEPRRADTLPESFKELGITGGDYSGCVGLGDLVLFEIPKARDAQREAYYAKRTGRMTDAISSDLQNEQVAGHPIAATNRSRVAVGR